MEAGGEKEFAGGGGGLRDKGKGENSQRINFSSADKVFCSLRRCCRGKKKGAVSREKKTNSRVLSHVMVTHAHVGRIISS